jgi:hypothetical protein
MAFFMGVVPKFFLGPMEKSVERVVQRMQSAAPPMNVRRQEQMPAAPGLKPGGPTTVLVGPQPTTLLVGPPVFRPVAGHRPLAFELRTPDIGLRTPDIGRRSGR